MKNQPQNNPQAKPDQQRQKQDDAQKRPNANERNEGGQEDKSRSDRS